MIPPAVAPSADTPGRLIPPAVRWLFVVALLLPFIAGIAYLAYRFRSGDSGLLSFFALQFDMMAEHNIPTWYASFLWIVLAALGMLGAVLTNRRISWIVLAGVAITAALDEYAQMHEWLDNIGNVLQEWLGTELWFTWVIPGVLIAVAVVAALLPLVWRLPVRQRGLLLLAGAVFLLGAVVVESISGLVLASFNDEITWHYYLITLVEETLELVGVCLAIAALAGLYEWRRNGGLRITFRGWRGEVESQAATA